jgi:hypothetical protein
MLWFSNQITSQLSLVQLEDLHQDADLVFWNFIVVIRLLLLHPLIKRYVHEIDMVIIAGFCPLSSYLYLQIHQIHG